MNNIFDEINARIMEIERNPIDKDTQNKINLIKSHMKDKIPFENVNIETMFGILEFLGYDENNIKRAYTRLISNINRPRQYVIDEEGEPVDERY